MSLALNLTQAAIKTYSKEVAKASSILLQHFNLNNFYYYKITDSGKFFLFDDNSEIIDYLDTQPFIYKHPHYCHPKYHHNSCTIEKTTENPLLIGLETTKKQFLSSGFNLSLSIVNRTENQVEEFGFHSAESSEEQIRFLFNHMPELRLFTKWFTKNNTSMLSFFKENTVNLPDLIGDTFYSDRIQQSNHDYQAMQQFFKKIGIEAEPNLSVTELELMKLIMNGYSAFQIGKQLYRSKRTIEHRIEALKLKLLCSSKVELISKAQELEYFRKFN